MVQKSPEKTYSFFKSKQWSACNRAQGLENGCQGVDRQLLRAAESSLPQRRGTQDIEAESLSFGECSGKIIKNILDFKGFIMFNDNAVVWVLEYIFGGILVVVSITGLALGRSVWFDTYIWAVYLFVVCLGVVLISCASSMRQRILLAMRIDRLAERIRERSASSQKLGASEIETE